MSIENGLDARMQGTVNRKLKLCEMCDFAGQINVIWVTMPFVCEI